MTIVSFDDFSDHFDDDIANIYIKYVLQCQGELQQFVKDKFPDGLKGKVYQPLPRMDPNIFTCAVTAIEGLMPGKLRHRLRLTYEAEFGRHMETGRRNQRDMLGYLFGGMWRRELVKQSEVVRMLDNENAGYAWQRNFTDGFKVDDRAMGVRIKLAWIDR